MSAFIHLTCTQTCSRMKTCFLDAVQLSVFQEKVEAQRVKIIILLRPLHLRMNTLFETFWLYNIKSWRKARNLVIQSVINQCHNAMWKSLQSLVTHLVFLFSWRCILGWRIKKSTLITAVACKNINESCRLVSNCTNLDNQKRIYNVPHANVKILAHTYKRKHYTLTTRHKRYHFLIQDSLFESHILFTSLRRQVI